jgi:hypothetical protein
MRLMLALALVVVCLPARSEDDQTQRAVQRALIELDQRSTEFAAQLRGLDMRELQSLHAAQLRDAGRPLSQDPEVARQLLAYERMRMSDERELRLPPPVVRAPKPAYEPLPLPGGLPHVVEPIAAPSVGG